MSMCTSPLSHSPDHHDNPILGLRLERCPLFSILCLLRPPVAARLASAAKATYCFVPLFVRVGSFPLGRSG